MASLALSPPTFTPFQIFVRSQFCTKPLPPPESTSLLGETAIVTGSNSGLGLATVEELLKLQVSRIIIAVRTVAKGENVAANLRKKYPAAKIEVWQLDMLSYDSITSFAKKCESLPRLDKVILNAGIQMPEFFLSKTTGHEETIQVNYISTALLAILLLPILKSRKSFGHAGRLTIVSSGLALQSKFPTRDAVPLLPSFDVMDGKWTLSDFIDRYATSKTLVLMLVQKLSEAVSSDDIIINAVEPGFVAGTGLQQRVAPVARFVTWVVKAITARSPKQGAWAYTSAVAVMGKESHGGLWMNWDIYPFHPMMYEKQGQVTVERLWEETLEELSFANVRDVVRSMGASV